MTRKIIDCRAVPNDVGCTLAITGEPGELITAAAHIAVVEFPGYTEAMANSGHPATAAFLKELQSICRTEPEFRNLDVRSVRAY